MDIPAPALAPVAGDNLTVLMWAVGVLVFVVAILARWFFVLFDSQGKKCKEENEKTWTKVEERDATILDLTKTYQAQAIETQYVLRDLTGALRDFSTLVREGETGKFQIPEPKPETNGKRRPASGENHR